MVLTIELIGDVKQQSHWKEISGGFCLNPNSKQSTLPACQFVEGELEIYSRRVWRLGQRKKLKPLPINLFPFGFLLWRRYAFHVAQRNAICSTWGGPKTAMAPQDPSGSLVAHGGNHALGSTWGDPKTAMAPQDRASSPQWLTFCPLPSALCLLL